MHRPKSNRPAKQKRALLESNPPRDNWIEGDEIKTVSTFGEAKTSPNQKLETFYFRAEPCLKNSRSDGRERLEPTTKNQWQKYLSFFSHAAFHAEPVQFYGSRRRTRCVLGS